MMQKSQNLKQTISAGGIVRRVINGKVQIVLVRDSIKHDWVLPKGHIEKGETIKESAIREVKEETGLANLTIVKKLDVKQRVSYERDEYKTIHYFLFDTTDDKDLTEIKDNDVMLTPKWFNIDNLPKLFWPEQQEIINESLGVIRNCYGN